jgi:hypothetical protein
VKCRRRAGMRRSLRQASIAIIHAVEQLNVSQLTFLKLALKVPNLCQKAQKTNAAKASKF